MASSGRTKELVSILLDEYLSLVAGKISNDNHTFLNTNDTRSGSPVICAKSKHENSIDTSRDFPGASECAQLNLKTWFGKAKTSTLSDAKRAEYAATAVMSENEAVARSREPEKSLEKSATVSMFLSTTFLAECAYTTQTQDWHI